MGVKIKGLKPMRDRLERLSTGFPSILENSMEHLFEDIISQSMENLRNRLLGTTYSHGHKDHVKMTDNLDLWDYERIGVSAGYHQWKLWNRSDHAAPVEFGSRTPIEPHGDWLYLGGGLRRKKVKGQEGKNFFHDALYGNTGKLKRDLASYTKSQIKQFLR